MADSRHPLRLSKGTLSRCKESALTLDVLFLRTFLPFCRRRGYLQGERTPRRRTGRMVGTLNQTFGLWQVERWGT